MEINAHLGKIEYFKDKDLSHAYDSLTGILGRGTMLSYIQWLTENKKPFSLFWVDIDNFKNVNDTYGHPIGDVVLTQVAAFLAEKAGDRGVVARYGGDEFLIVFEGVTEYKDVWACGHDIDMNIGSINFDGIPNLLVTVSIGIARSPLDADDYESLLTVADRALYRAKMKGRNCFIIYLPEKHANISLKKERDKKLTSMQLCANLFSSLTASGEDISLAIISTFRSFVSQFMYDHICIETREGLNFSVVHTLAKKKDFKHIPYSMINSVMNSVGYTSLNNATMLNEDVYSDMIEEFKKQEIVSTLYCKIAAYGHDYGIIRVDTSSTVRIWQNTEVSLVMVAANMLGLLLYYQKKQLEDLPYVAPSEAGSVN